MVASFHIDQEALVWYQEAMEAEVFSNWETLVQALHVRFGSTAYDDPMKALAWLRQISIVGMYKAEFEALSNENHILSNALAITLQKPIKIDLAFPKPIKIDLAFPKPIKIDFPRFKGEEHVAW